MAPRKTLASGVKAGPVAVAVSQPLISNRKVPALLRFPLLVLLNLSLSALFYSLASGVTAGDLSTVSRSINDWWEVAGLLAWKASELAAGWWGQYDGKFSSRTLRQLIVIFLTAFKAMISLP